MYDRKLHSEISMLYIQNIITLLVQGHQTFYSASPIFPINIRSKIYHTGNDDNHRACGHVGEVRHKQACHA